MTEPASRMTLLERAAGLLLVCVLGALMLHREPTQRAVRADPYRPGCGRLQTCLDLETRQLGALSEHLLAGDWEEAAAMERELVDTRRALARFSPEDDVHYDDELGSHDMRAEAVGRLAETYAELPADARAALARAR